MPDFHPAKGVKSGILLLIQVENESAAQCSIIMTPDRL